MRQKNIPGHYTFKDRVLYIGDWVNSRFQIVDLDSGKVETISDGVQELGANASAGPLAFVSRNGDIVSSGGGVYKSVEQVWKPRKMGSGTKYMVEIGNNYLGQAQSGFIVYDSLFSIVTSYKESGISDSLRAFGGQVIYVLSRKAFLSTNIIQLRKVSLENYKMLTDKKADQSSTIFQLPDTSQVPASIPPESRSAFIANYDSSLNSYWITSGDSMVAIEDSYSENPKAPHPVICVFDRIGRRIVWFYEPSPRKGWFFTENFHVNKEGRMFRMLYHPTEGIEVYEYLWRDKGKGITPKK